MNKSESKYFNTSRLMNQALIELVNKKDYEFITIKEICKKAGVSRSTFYLHYDNVDDLLAETMENLDKEFFACFGQKDLAIAKDIRRRQKDELILISPKYLLPYLCHVKEHRLVYMAAAKYPALMKSYKKYKYLKEKILFPIFAHFNISDKDKDFIAAYYISGVYAIIDEWITRGCREETEDISALIIKCVRPIYDKPERENKED